MSCHATCHCRHDSTHLVEQGQWWRLESARCCACRRAASRGSDTCTLNRSSCPLSALPLNKCSGLIHCSTDWSWTPATARPSQGATHTHTHASTSTYSTRLETNKILVYGRKCVIIRLIVWIFKMKFHQTHIFTLFSSFFLAQQRNKFHVRDHAWPPHLHASVYCSLTIWSQKFRRMRIHDFNSSWVLDWFRVIDCVPFSSGLGEQGQR